jgi:peptidoglycan/LPS O-acetylase OafA/YrhL
MSCEAFFYLTFPVLVRPIRRMRGRNLVIVVSLVFLLEWVFRMWLGRLGPLEKPQSLMLARLPISRLVEFLLGVTAAVAVQRGWRPPLGVRASMVALAACALTVRYGVGSDWWSGGWYNQALAPAMVLLIASSTAARDVDGAVDVAPTLAHRPRRELVRPLPDPFVGHLEAPRPRGLVTVRVKSSSSLLDLTPRP